MPRIFGHDVIALITAIIAFYAVGFVIYGLLFSELWREIAGYGVEDFAGHEWKMVLSPVMPILIVLGLTWMLHRSGAAGLTAHLKLAGGVWLVFMVPVMMYGYVYGLNYPLALWAMDSAHLLIATLAASAILVWRKGAKA